GFGRGFLDGRLGGGAGLGNEGLCSRLAVGDDVVGLLHRIGPGLLCPLRSLLGFAVGLGGPSLRFFDELLVLGLRLFVALLALGLGFLALGGELDIEVVAGLLRGLVASLGRREQLIGLSLCRRHGLLGLGLGLGPQIRRFLLGRRAQFGEFVIEALACFLGRGVVGLLGLIRLAFGAGLELGRALLGSLDRLFGAQFGRGDDRIGLGPRIGQGVIALSVHPSPGRSSLGAGLVPDGLGIGIGLSQSLTGLGLGDLEQVVDPTAGRARGLGIVVSGLLQLSLGLREFACDLQLRPIGVDDLTPRIGQRLADRFDFGAQLLKARIAFTLFVAAHRCAEFFGGRH